MVRSLAASTNLKGRKTGGTGNCTDGSHAMRRPVAAQRLENRSRQPNSHSNRSSRAEPLGPGAHAASAAGTATGAATLVGSPFAPGGDPGELGPAAAESGRVGLEAAAGASTPELPGAGAASPLSGARLIK